MKAPPIFVDMAREFAKAFYSSKRWQDCRNDYARQARHLCERCLKRGLIVPGEIVHHKIELTSNNINTPEIALDFNNLELLCRECHAEIHDDKHKGMRYAIGQNGEVII